MGLGGAPQDMHSHVLFVPFLLALKVLTSITPSRTVCGARDQDGCLLWLNVHGEQAVLYGMEQRLSGCSLPEWHHLQSSRWLHFKDKCTETPPPVQQEAEITLVHICNRLASMSLLALNSSIRCWSVSKPFQKNQTLELVKHTRPTMGTTYGRSLGAYQPDL